MEPRGIARRWAGAETRGGPEGGSTCTYSLREKIPAYNEQAVQ